MRHALATPSDLLPELQGRLPIRVELRALERNDFKRILTEPKASLIKQYTALMKTEGVTLNFKDNIYFLAKIFSTDGLSFQFAAATMTGMSQEEYKKMMIEGGRSPEGNLYKEGDSNG